MSGSVNGVWGSHGLVGDSLGTAMKDRQAMIRRNVEPPSPALGDLKPVNQVSRSIRYRARFSPASPYVEHLTPFCPHPILTYHQDMLPLIHPSGHDYLVAQVSQHCFTARQCPVKTIASEARVIGPVHLLHRGTQGDHLML